MPPFPFRRKAETSADAAVEGGSGALNKEPIKELKADQPSSASASARISRSPSSAAAKKKEPPVVKLSRPPLPFLFALFLNQFYINLIVLVPRQVGIYIIRNRFLPQNDPEAQLTAGAKYGTLMSANNFAQLASSYFWGWASDATGRKPLLLLSNVVSGAASAWFVSTRTFGQGLAARALSGCFMCSGVVMKAMIGLHYTKQGQAIAMAWRTLGAGVGQIATPLIIAALSDPCTLYRNGALGRSAACRPGGFLADDPFVLCGFFTVLVGVVATLTNWYLVPRDPPKEWATRLRARMMAGRKGRRKEERKDEGRGAEEGAERKDEGRGAEEGAERKDEGRGAEGGAASAAATGAAVGSSSSLATAAAAAAAAKVDADGSCSSRSSSSSSGSDVEEDEADELAGGGLLTNGEDALTSLLSVLSFPPQPAEPHHFHRRASAAAAAPPPAPFAAPAASPDVEDGGGSAPALSFLPRGGRLPAVPSSAFLAHSQGPALSRATVDDEMPTGAPAAPAGGSLGGRAAAQSAAIPEAAAAAASAADDAAVRAPARRRHSVAFLPQEQQQRRRSSLVFGGGGGGNAPANESAFSRRLSAAATSFGVLAIAAGEYGNTINDVDAARTAAAVARQQSALRQRRRASSLATAASSAAGPRPFSLSLATAASSAAGPRPSSLSRATAAAAASLSSAKPSSSTAAPSSPSKGKPQEKEKEEDTAADVEKAVASSAPVAAPADVVPWWRCKAALVAIFAFATTTMLNESVLDLYQFYATSTPCLPRGPGAEKLPDLANAGLCLDVTETSLTVAVGGAGVVAFSILAYPPLQRRFGVAFCCKFGLLVGAAMCLVMAAARYAYPLGDGPLLAALVGAQLLYGVGFSATSTASMIMVNLCAPAGQVGAVNGAANLMMSASRIVGPFIVGTAWDATEKSIKLDQWFPFGLFAGLFTATLAGYVLLGVSDDGLD